jgi:hypothetical protein
MIGVAKRDVKAATANIQAQNATMTGAATVGGAIVCVGALNSVDATLTASIKRTIKVGATSIVAQNASLVGYAIPYNPQQYSLGYLNSRASALYGSVNVLRDGVIVTPSTNTDGTINPNVIGLQQTALNLDLDNVPLIEDPQIREAVLHIHDAFDILSNDYETRIKALEDESG